MLKNKILPIKRMPEVKIILNSDKNLQMNFPKLPLFDKQIKKKINLKKKKEKYENFQILKKNSLRQISDEIKDNFSHQSKIMKVFGLYIKKKISLVEIISGCNLENEYEIFEKKKRKLSKDQNKEDLNGRDNKNIILGEMSKKKKIKNLKQNFKIVNTKEINKKNLKQKNFKKKNFVKQKKIKFSRKKKLYIIEDKSKCISKNCLTINCQGIKLVIKNYIKKKKKICLILEKKKRCSFFCLNRKNSMNVFFKKNLKIFLGKIQQIFSILNYNKFYFQILNEKNYLIYKIFLDCCQCSFLCQGSNCKKCKKIIFRIFDQKNNFICNLQKTNKNCFEEFDENSDYFEIEFNEDMDWKVRSLIMSAALFIDYVMFGNE